MVSELAVCAAGFMERSGYSAASRNAYQRIWGQFEEYCALTGLLKIDRSVAGLFVAAVGAQGSAPWQVFYRRAVGCLFDMAEIGRFSLRNGHGFVGVAPGLVGMFDAWSDHVASRGLAASTVRSKTGALRRFLGFLVERGVGHASAITSADVSAYVTSLASLAPSTRAGHLYFLREYLRFVVCEHDAEQGLARMFPVIVTDKDAVLPSVYRPDQVAGLLAQAGKGSRTPLRDIAMLLLAAILGLRSSDIKTLRFDQIDWVNKRLSIIQAKTGRRLDLPLLDECAYAIIDYWKNERPDSDQPVVFLRARAPHQPLNPGNHFHDTVTRCFSYAGVDTTGKHHGVHALRHSVAVSMLISKTPYPVIGAVLGHANANTTRRYLRVDITQLRALALEVPNAG